MKDTMCQVPRSDFWPETVDQRTHSQTGAKRFSMIKLKQKTEQHLIGSIQRYFDEHMDEEIGDLKAAMLLAFCVEEIGPTIYNQAIRDAQANLQTQVEDLSGTCYESEFGYWKKMTT